MNSYIISTLSLAPGENAPAKRIVSGDMAVTRRLLAEMTARRLTISPWVTAGACAEPHATEHVVAGAELGRRPADVLDVGKRVRLPRRTADLCLPVGNQAADDAVPAAEPVTPGP